jgi:ribosomal protein L14
MTIRTILHCADNTRAKKIECIRIFKDLENGIHFKRVVKSVLSRTRRVKKSDIVNCLLIRSKQGTKGVRFSQNGCIILQPKTFKPLRSRIFRPIQLPEQDRKFAEVLKLVNKPSKF